MLRTQSSYRSWRLTDETKLLTTQILTSAIGRPTPPKLVIDTVFLLLFLRCIFEERSWAVIYRGSGLVEAGLVQPEVDGGRCPALSLHNGLTRVHCSMLDPRVGTAPVRPGPRIPNRPLEKICKLIDHSFQISLLNLN